jgi:outer membrane protein OmpA-like peptidoglycan-associated protein
MIGTYAGIKKNSSTMYSSLAAPILIDAVSKEIDNGKLDVDGLITFLADHHEPLFKKAPEDLLEKMIPQLGLQELQSPKFASAKKIVSGKPVSIKGKPIVNSDVPTATTDEVEETEEVSESSPFPIKWLAIFLLAAAAIAGGVYWYKNYYEPSQAEPVQEEVILPAIDSITMKADSAVVDSAAVKVDTANKVATPSLTSNEQFSSFGEQLNTYLVDKTKPTGQVFPISNVAFVRGSQALDSESDLIISELSDLMTKYPKMQIQLQGHSNDAVGTDNKSMATKRAFSIKKKLLAKGIVETRIDAIGVTGAGNGADVKIVSK